MIEAPQRTSAPPPGRVRRRPAPSLRQCFLAGVLGGVVGAVLTALLPTWFFGIFLAAVVVVCWFTMRPR